MPAGDKSKFLDAVSGEYRVTALMNAISSKNYSFALKLIELGANISIANKLGQTILYYLSDVTAVDQTEEYKNLVELVCAKIGNMPASDKSKFLDDVGGEYEMTILINAISYKNYLFAKELVKLGANISIANKLGQTILIYLSDVTAVDQTEEYKNLVELVCAKIGNMPAGDKSKFLDAVIGEYEMTILINAISRNKFSFALKLISIGANISIANKLGQTILYYLSGVTAVDQTEEYKNLVELVCAKIGNMPAGDKSKFLDAVSGEYRVTALMNAISSKNYSFALKLISIGANISIANKLGQTILYYLSDVTAVDQIEEYKSLVELVFTKIGNMPEDGKSKFFDAVSGEYRVTALMNAISSKNYSFALKLISIGANISTANKLGQTILYYLSGVTAVDQIEEYKSLVELVFTKIGNMPEDGKSKFFDAVSRKYRVTALLNAISSKNYSFALKLIELGANISIANNKDETILQFMAQRDSTLPGYSELEKLVFNRIVDIVAEDKAKFLDAASGEYRVTALMDAISYKNYLFAAKLINAGANISIANNLGANILYYTGVIENKNQTVGYQKLLDLLFTKIHAITDLEKRSSILDKTSNDEMTTTMNAIVHKNYSFAAKLINAGANISIANNLGQTILYYLASVEDENQTDDYKKLVGLVFTKIDMITDLEKRSKTLNAIHSNHATTPLMNAIAYKNYSFAYKLIDLGADISKVNNLGITILHYLADVVDADQTDDYKKLIDLLFIKINMITDLEERSKNLNAINSNHAITPLMEAITYKNYSFAAKLIELGADITTANKKGQTILHYLAEVAAEYQTEDYKKIVDLLFIKIIEITDLEERSKNLNAIHSNHAITPLMQAICWYNFSFAAKLINAGANIFIASKLGQTILHCLSDITDKDQTEEYKNLVELVCAKIGSMPAGDKSRILDTNIIEDKITAIMEAISNENYSFAFKLIELGANIFKANDKDETILHYLSDIADEDQTHDYNNLVDLVLGKIDKFDDKSEKLNLIKKFAPEDDTLNPYFLQKVEELRKKITQSESQTIPGRFVSAIAREKGTAGSIKR
jgi:ankyrin repeat protein